MLEGTPDVWIDGKLFRLAPGERMGLPAGAGIAQSSLGGPDDPGTRDVAGETPKAENRIVYPVNLRAAAARKD